MNPIPLIRLERGLTVKYDEVVVRFCGNRDAVMKWINVLERTFGRAVKAKVNKIRGKKLYTVDYPMTMSERFKMDVELLSETAMRGKSWRRLLTFNVV